MYYTMNNERRETRSPSETTTKLGGCLQANWLGGLAFGAVIARAASAARQIDHCSLRPLLHHRSARKCCIALVVALLHCNSPARLPTGRLAAQQLKRPDETITSASGQQLQGMAARTWRKTFAA